MGQLKLNSFHAATIHRSRSSCSTRLVLIIGVAVVWAFSIALIIYLLLGNSNHSVQFSDVQQLGSLRHWLRGAGHHSPTPQACDASAQPSPDDIQKLFAKYWGHSCVAFRQACYDQGTFVVYGKQHHPWHKGKAPISALKLGNNHLDFKEFGDVIGITQYPEIIFRPANKNEETADLRSPVFSNCARPVVLYLNHLYMFGDFWVRIMPTLMNALAAGAWDTDYTIVVATGGQSLEPWQKLVLQPVSKHPIITLSKASSRATAHIPPSDAANNGSSIGSTTGRRLHSLTNERQQQWQQWQERSYNIQQQQQQVPAKVAGQVLPDEQHMQQWAHWQQQWQSYRQQHVLAASSNPGQQLLRQQTLSPSVFTEPDVTQYGRCFESLTVCSIQNPKVFGTRAPQETWRGAQYVKAYWEHQYGASYKQLLPQYASMKQSGVFKVVIAVRGSSAVRNLLNQQELLDWCNNWIPTAAGPGSSTSSSRYTRTVCVAHQFGQHGKVHTQPQHLEAASGSSQASSSSSSKGRVFKSLSAVQAWAEDVAGTVMGFVSGHRARVLLATDPRLQSEHQQAAATAAAHRDLLSEQHDSTDPSQSQSNEPTASFDRPADLPEDPQLDPRALLSDFALLDEADVVVGLHGAQLYNALFMPAYASLIEVRPLNFTGGWPEMYFKEPLVGSDNMDSIFWFGIDTVNPTNSQPGKWEKEGTGCCHERDRHTRIEPAALEYLLRRIIWADRDPGRYRQLDGAKETHITDTLQTAAEYYKQQAAKVIGQVDDGYMDIAEPDGTGDAKHTENMGSGDVDNGPTKEQSTGQSEQTRADAQADQRDSKAAQEGQLLQEQKQQEKPASQQEQKQGADSPQQQKQQQAVALQEVQLTPEQLSAAEQVENELRAEQELIAWEAKEFGPPEHHVASWKEIADDYDKQPL